MALATATNPSIRVSAAAAALAVAALAATVAWAQHEDSSSAVKAAAVGSLPPKVQQAFTDRVRLLTDARGPLPVTYVQSTLGPASVGLTGGTVAEGADTPVYVLFVGGTFHFLALGHNGAGAGPGGILDIVGLDGTIYTGGSQGSQTPDLSKYGTPLTTVVDFGS